MKSKRRYYRKTVATAVVTVLILAGLSWGVVRAATSENITIYYVPASSGVTLPTVTTTAPSSHDPPMILTGNVTGDGGATIVSRGFVWSLSSHADPGNVDPSATAYEFMWSEAGVFAEGVFTYQPPDLEDNTDYHGRAFAKNSEGCSYGNETIFNPIPPYSSARQVAELVPVIYIVVTILGVLAFTAVNLYYGIIYAGVAIIVGVTILSSLIEPISLIA